MDLRSVDRALQSFVIAAADPCNERHREEVLRILVPVTNAGEEVLEQQVLLLRALARAASSLVNRNGRPMAEAALALIATWTPLPVGLPAGALRVIQLFLSNLVNASSGGWFAAAFQRLLGLYLSISMSAPGEDDTWYQDVVESFGGREKCGHIGGRDDAFSRKFLRTALAQMLEDVPLGVPHAIKCIGGIIRRLQYNPLRVYSWRSPGKSTGRPDWTTLENLYSSSIAASDGSRDYADMAVASQVEVGNSRASRSQHDAFEHSGQEAALPEELEEQAWPPGEQLGEVDLDKLYLQLCDLGDLGDEVPSLQVALVKSLTGALFWLDSQFHSKTAAEMRRTACRSDPVKGVRVQSLREDAKRMEDDAIAAPGVEGSWAEHSNLVGEVKRDSIMVDIERNSKAQEEASTSVGEKTTAGGLGQTATPDWMTALEAALVQIRWTFPSVSLADSHLDCRYCCRHSSRLATKVKLRADRKESVAGPEVGCKAATCQAAAVDLQQRNCERRVADGNRLPAASCKCQVAVWLAVALEYVSKWCGAHGSLGVGEASEEQGSGKGTGSVWEQRARSNLFGAFKSRVLAMPMPGSPEVLLLHVLCQLKSSPGHGRSVGKWLRKILQESSPDWLQIFARDMHGTLPTSLEQPCRGLSPCLVPSSSYSLDKPSVSWQAADSAQAAPHGSDQDFTAGPESDSWRVLGSGLGAGPRLSERPWLEDGDEGARGEGEAKIRERGSAEGGDDLRDRNVDMEIVRESPAMQAEAAVEDCGRREGKGGSDAETGREGQEESSEEAEEETQEDCRSPLKMHFGRAGKAWSSSLRGKGEQQVEEGFRESARQGVGSLGEVCPVEQVGAEAGGTGDGVEENVRPVARVAGEMGERAAGFKGDAGEGEEEEVMAAEGSERREGMGSTDSRAGGGSGEREEQIWKALENEGTGMAEEIEEEEAERQANWEVDAGMDEEAGKPGAQGMASMEIEKGDGHEKRDRGKGKEVQSEEEEVGLEADEDEAQAEWGDEKICAAGQAAGVKREEGVAGEDEDEGEQGEDVEIANLDERSDMGMEVDMEIAIVEEQGLVIHANEEKRETRGEAYVRRRKQKRGREGSGAHELAVKRVLRPRNHQRAGLDRAVAQVKPESRDWPLQEAPQLLGPQRRRQLASGAGKPLGRGQSRADVALSGSSPVRRQERWGREVCALLGVKREREPKAEPCCGGQGGPLRGARGRRDASPPPCEAPEKGQPMAGTGAGRNENRPGGMQADMQIVALEAKEQGLGPGTVTRRGKRRSSKRGAKAGAAAAEEKHSRSQKGDREQTERCKWLELPEDLLQLVLSKLGSRSVLRAAGVCSTWRQVARGEEVWAVAYATRWRQLPPEKPATWPRGRRRDMSWMEAYIQRAKAGPSALPCPRCGKAFPRHEKHLQACHIATHLRPHKCKVEGCDRAFAVLRDLRAHLAGDPARGGHGQSELLAHCCPKCKKRFRCKYRLAMHIQSVHGRKRLKDSKVRLTPRDLRFNCTAKNCRSSYLEWAQMLQHCRKMGHAPPSGRGKHKRHGGPKGRQKCQVAEEACEDEKS